MAILQREIGKLKKMILALGARVEESVRLAVKSIRERDAALAEKVAKSDHEIDVMEVDVEEECLKILALHQPVAVDLRFIVAVIKMNSDLERIGDLAVNIAERSQLLAAKAKVEMPFDFTGMAEKVQAMLRKSLDALVNMDVKLAREVCASDDEVDAIHRDMYAKMQETLRREPEKADVLIPVMTVSRQLERIADHATNIAEDVLYLVEGDIHRHGL
jgi:phosphate transport system protein